MHVSLLIVSVQTSHVNFSENIGHSCSFTHSDEINSDIAKVLDLVQQHAPITNYLTNERIIEENIYSLNEETLSVSRHTNVFDYNDAIVCETFNQGGEDLGNIINNIKDNADICLPNIFSYKRKQNECNLDFMNEEKASKHAKNECRISHSIDNPPMDYPSNQYIQITTLPNNVNISDTVFNIDGFMPKNNNEENTPFLNNQPSKHSNLDEISKKCVTKSVCNQNNLSLYNNSTMKNFKSFAAIFSDIHKNKICEMCQFASQNLPFYHRNCLYKFIKRKINDISHKFKSIQLSISDTESDNFFENLIGCIKSSIDPNLFLQIVKSETDALKKNNHSLYCLKFLSIDEEKNIVYNIFNDVFLSYNDGKVVNTFIKKNGTEEYSNSQKHVTKNTRYDENLYKIVDRNRSTDLKNMERTIYTNLDKLKDDFSKRILYDINIEINKVNSFVMYTSHQTGDVNIKILKNGRFQSKFVKDVIKSNRFVYIQSIFLQIIKLEEFIEKLLYKTKLAYYATLNTCSITIEVPKFHDIQVYNLYVDHEFLQNAKKCDTYKFFVNDLIYFTSDNEFLFATVKEKITEICDMFLTLETNYEKIINSLIEINTDNSNFKAVMDTTKIKNFFINSFDNLDKNHILNIFLCEIQFFIDAIKFDNIVIHDVLRDQELLLYVNVLYVFTILISCLKSPNFIQFKELNVNNYLAFLNHPSRLIFLKIRFEIQRLFAHIIMVMVPEGTFNLFIEKYLSERLYFTFFASKINFDRKTNKINMFGKKSNLFFLSKLFFLIMSSSNVLFTSLIDNPDFSNTVFHFLTLSTSEMFERFFKSLDKTNFIVKLFIYYVLFEPYFNNLVWIDLNNKSCRKIIEMIKTMSIVKENAYVYFIRSNFDLPYMKNTRCRLKIFYRIFDIIHLVEQNYVFNGTLVYK
ncbi:hypothetical protein COBT_000697 [Conglomerata obtusa]